MVLGGIASLEEVGKDDLAVDEGQTHRLGSLHDTDTPVDISRMTVLQVVLLLSGDVRADVESLMAYQHPLAERLPRQFLRWAKPAQMEELSFFVDNSRVAIDDGRGLRGKR